MTDIFTIQGRQLRPLELAQVQALLTEHPDWSRYRLSRQLATLWDWCNPAGQLKDTCRCASPNRMRHKPRPTLDVPAPAVPITSALAQLLPLTIRVLSWETRRTERALFDALLCAHSSKPLRSTWMKAACGWPATCIGCMSPALCI